MTGLLWIVSWDQGLPPKLPWPPPMTSAARNKTVTPWVPNWPLPKKRVYLYPENGLLTGQEESYWVPPSFSVSWWPWPQQLRGLTFPGVIAGSLP